MRRLIALVVGAGAAGALASCRPAIADPAAANEVRAAVTAYLTQLETRPVNIDSLAVFYDSTAEVLEPGVVTLKGIDRVRHFLSSYQDVILEQAEFGIDTIEVHGSSAYVWGFFSQRTRRPDSTSAEARARAVFVWTRSADGRWRIVRTLTQPVGG